MTRLARRGESITLTMNTTGITEAFVLDGVMGVVEIPSAWTAASLGFKAATSEDGTYLPLYGSDAALLQIASPSTSTVYVLPAELAAASYVKLWSQDGSAGDTAQAAARTLKLTVKS